MPLPAPDLAGLPRPLRDLVVRALTEDPVRRPTAHELLDELIQAGAAGDRVIRASLRTHPGLKRAASAVQHTAPVAAPAAVAGNTPVRPGKTGLATLEQPPASWLRWLPPRIVSAIAVAALATGFGAYPATSRLLDANREPVAAAGDPALEQRADAPEKPSRGDRRSRCTLEGPLRAQVWEPAAFICPLAAGTDQTIDTMIEVGAPGVCAAVGTHVAARSSYRIAICADHVTIDCIYRGRVSSLASAILDSGLEPGRRHRAEVITAGAVMTVIVNGKTVVSGAELEPRLDPGAVTLGAIGYPSTRKTGSATFSDFTVSTTT